MAERQVTPSGKNAAEDELVETASPETSTAPGSPAPRPGIASQDVLSETEAAAAEFVARMDDASPPMAASQDILAQIEATREAVSEEKDELLSDAAEERRQRMDEVERARKERRPLKPVTASTVNTFNDPTLAMLVDDSGGLAGTPGYHKRIVRMRNLDGKQDISQAQRFRSVGYRPVLDAATGKPVVSELGMLMECPPECEAARKASAEKAVVPLEQYERDQAENLAETLNRRHGRQIGRVFRGDEHGERV